MWAPLLQKCAAAAAVEESALCNQVESCCIIDLNPVNERGTLMELVELIKLHNPELTARAANVGQPSSHWQAVWPAWVSLNRWFGITVRLPFPDLRSE